MHNSHIEDIYALVGSWDDVASCHVWVYVDDALAMVNVGSGIWEYRGYRYINGQYTRLYYLPPPPP